VSRRAHALRVTFLALAVGIASGVGVAPASAKVKRCSVHVQVRNRALSNAGVTSVRDMSCRAARHAIRRYGSHRVKAAYGEAGDRFRLGPWSCTVYLHDYELWRARCVRGGRAFRVDYGF
jgi:hypothetical protein